MGDIDGDDEGPEPTICCRAQARPRLLVDSISIPNVLSGEYAEKREKVSAINSRCRSFQTVKHRLPEANS
jgi:hypothetical protein